MSTGLTLRRIFLCVATLLPQRVQVRATPEQKAALEASFSENNKPSVGQRSSLAKEIGLTDKYIENWFATRRQKEKKKGAEGAAGANGDAAAEAPKEGPEKPAKRAKVSHTAVPADAAAREQLEQLLAAEQLQLTEVFTAEQTLEPLNLLEGPLAEGDGLKRAVRAAPVVSGASFRSAQIPIRSHCDSGTTELPAPIDRAVDFMSCDVKLALRMLSACTFTFLIFHAFRTQVACVLEGRSEGIDGIVQLVCEGLQARGETVAEEAVRELIPQVGERQRFCAVGTQKPDVVRRPFSAAPVPQPRPRPAASTISCLLLAQRLRPIPQANSLTDESKDQLWRWRAKDASLLPDAVRTEALWLRTRTDGCAEPPGASCRPFAVTVPGLAGVRRGLRRMAATQPETSAPSAVSPLPPAPWSGPSPSPTVSDSLPCRYLCRLSAGSCSA